MDTTTISEELVVALAGLYLDTEVRDGLPRLAERMVSSGLSARELQALWRRQITPCVHRNLKSDRGEWAGFDRDWLLTQVARRRERPGVESWPVIGAVVHLFRAFAAESEFRVALALATRLSMVPWRERARRVAIWEALTQIYFASDAHCLPGAADRRVPIQVARRNANRIASEHALDRMELSDEFAAICDLLPEVLSSEQLRYIAESNLASWLESVPSLAS